MELPAHPDLWPHVVGYMFAIVAPIWGIRGASRQMRITVLLQQGVPPQHTSAKPHPFLPLLVGIVERFLYVAALMMGLVGPIGVWLGLKVAGGWKDWSQGQTHEWRSTAGASVQTLVSGRNVLNLFLVSSALSLIVSIVGAAIIVWLNVGSYAWALKAGAAALAFVYGLWGFFYLRNRALINKYRASEARAA